MDTYSRVDSENDQRIDNIGERWISHVLKFMGVV